MSTNRCVINYYRVFCSEENNNIQYKPRMIKSRYSHWLKTILFHSLNMGTLRDRAERHDF